MYAVDLAGSPKVIDVRIVGADNEASMTSEAERVSLPLDPVVALKALLALEPNAPAPPATDRSTDPARQPDNKNTE